MQGILGSKEETKDEKPHYQCYVQFIKKVRPSGVKKVFPAGEWHHEIARGSLDENRKYCNKEGSHDYEELGMLLKQGSPTQMKVVSDRIEEGASYTELWSEFRPFMIRHYRGVQEAIAVRNRRPVERTFKKAAFAKMKIKEIGDWKKSWIFFGPPGCGKTSYALSLFENPLLVSHIDQLKFLEPNNHDGIVFDDMNFRGSGEHEKGRWPVGSCIHLVDTAYHRDINVKHTTAYIPAGMKRIFCTNMPGGQIFPEQTTTSFGIRRRIDYIDFGQLKFAADNFRNKYDSTDVLY